MLVPGALALALVFSACTSTSPSGPTAGTALPPDTTAGTAAPPGPTGEACRATGATATKGLAYREVDGVDPNLLALDLYLPVRAAGCPPVPVVVYVHGGGFVRGDKARAVDDKVDALTAGEGWALASVNYRLSPDVGAAGDGAAEVVRYPVHEQDVATAIAWLAEHAGEHGIDPDRILMIGHSSGAYLVSLLATDTSFLRDAGVDPAHVRCVASLDTEYDAAAQVAQGGSQETLYRNALGDDPAVWAEASPRRHVADPGPHPRFLVVTQGTPRRTAQARQFADALVAAGTPATVVEASSLDHEGVNDAVGAPGDTVVTPPLLDLFRSCVGEP